MLEHYLGWPIVNGEPIQNSELWTHEQLEDATRRLNPQTPTMVNDLLAYLRNYHSGVLEEIYVPRGPTEPPPRYGPYKPRAKALPA